MKKIGLLSDTHGEICHWAENYFKDCDEIWHAGDVGSVEVIQHLQTLKPLRGVYGNIDNSGVKDYFEKDLIFEIEGLSVFMTHIGALPPNYNTSIRTKIESVKPGLFICGHSHILRIIPDRLRKLIYMNPGACGSHGFHQIKTAIRFDINEGKLQNVEVIELGKRGVLA